MSVRALATPAESAGSAVVLEHGQPAGSDSHRAAQTARLLSGYSRTAGFKGAKTVIVNRQRDWSAPQVGLEPATRG
jgi:hypothetical protein